ncbi:unnamed protein product [Moneuplotes crassus]|uniref:Uncharacterized protein n=1 Tax=Euplotes crassus TaxID=5936 RepID=A0AAD1UFN4_EUPCR|nr:unnamed protein product [Moneuplotes crassus]
MGNSSCCHTAKDSSYQYNRDTFTGANEYSNFIIYEGMNRITEKSVRLEDRVSLSEGFPSTKMKEMGMNRKTQSNKRGLLQKKGKKKSIKNVRFTCIKPIEEDIPVFEGSQERKLDQASSNNTISVRNYA